MAKAYNPIYGQEKIQISSLFERKYSLKDLKSMFPGDWFEREVSNTIHLDKLQEASDGSFDVPIELIYQKTFKRFILSLNGNVDLTQNIRDVRKFYKKYF